MVSLYFVLALVLLLSGYLLVTRYFRHTSVSRIDTDPMTTKPSSFTIAVKGFGMKRDPDRDGFVISVFGRYKCGRDDCILMAYEGDLLPEGAGKSPERPIGKQQIIKAGSGRFRFAQSTSSSPPSEWHVEIRDTKTGSRMALSTGKAQQTDK